MKAVWRVALSSLALGGSGFAARAAEIATAPLMRFPTSSRTELAFVARGELWVAPREGGQAHPVMQGDGHISAARFSPDGRWIAFTHRRGGGQDVYVIPAIGGAPRRLTFDARSNADDNLVSGWTPDGRRIVFLSHRGPGRPKCYRLSRFP